MTAKPSVALSASGRVATVVVTGDLDLHTVPALREALLTGTKAGPDVLHVDLVGVDFCDSTGMSVLATAAKRMGVLGGRLVVSGAQPLPYRVFALTGLTALVEVHPADAGDLSASWELEHTPD
ncbi:MAG: STAS domain-containing protein [Mycobacteriales bacterium]|nr:STAS domain-containing protein [Mycobacteriales bacterium]